MSRAIEPVVAPITRGQFWLRVMVTLAAAALAVVASPTRTSAAPAPLPASAADTCVGGKQVWLLVVTDSGSQLASRCVGTPSSGEAALSSVGFTHRSDGIICTIAGYPSVCKPASQFDGRYWSYWTATPGGSWTYSQMGAGNRTPPPGSLEGWCYTKPASEPTQKATCISQLTSRINPASVSSTAPTTTAPKPTQTSQPKPTRTATTSRPTTAKPTTAKPTQGRPTSTKPGSKPTSQQTTKAAQPSRTATTTRPSSSQKASPSAKPSSTKPSASRASASPSSAKPSTPKPSENPTGTQSTTSSVSTPPASTPAADETPVVAQVTESGSPTGLLVTGGVIALGAAGAGVYLWRSRQG